MAPYILVVDDEPAIGKLLLYQLSGFGYRVSYLQNGLLALQRLLADRPDLVLLDVMMPMISGWEVCRQIRACSNVPVIMLTAKSAEGDVVTGLSAGADDYLTKPFSMAQLQARIEAVLRRTSASQPAYPAPARGEPAPAPIPTRPAPDGPRPAPAERSIRPIRTGQQLRDARIGAGIALHQAERECNVRWEFLQAIEQENWEYIPRRELRRTITAYGAYLHLDLVPLHTQAQAELRPFTLLRYAFLAVVLAVVVIGLFLL